MFSLFITIMAIFLVTMLASFTLYYGGNLPIHPSKKTYDSSISSENGRHVKNEQSVLVERKEVKQPEPIIQRTEVSTVNNYDFKTLSDTLKMIFFAIFSVFSLKYALKTSKYLLRKLKFMMYEKKSKYMILNISKNLNNKSYILSFIEEVERQLLKNKLLLEHAHNEEVGIDLKVLDEELKNKFNFVSNKLIMDMK